MNETTPKTGNVQSQIRRTTMTQLMTARKLTKSEMQAVQGGNILLWLLAGCGGSSGGSTSAPAAPATTKPCDNSAGRGYTTASDGTVEKCGVQQNPDGSGCTDRKIPL
jgi:hypothetical protein